MQKNEETIKVSSSENFNVLSTIFDQEIDENSSYDFSENIEKEIVFHEKGIDDVYTEILQMYEEIMIEEENISEVLGSEDFNTPSIISDREMDEDSFCNLSESIEKGNTVGDDIIGNKEELEIFQTSKFEEIIKEKPAVVTKVKNDIMEIGRAHV